MTTPSPRLTSSPADAPAELDSFARFCERNLTAEDSRPFILEPFERTFLAEHFEGISETVVLAPKKQGKSSTLAALSTYHLLTVPFGEVAVVAASRDQAGNLLRLAQGFIRRSPALQKRLRVKQREIVNDELGGRVRVLASDVDTFDGWLGTLGLVDELGRHRSPELYGLIREGIGPRNGQMVTISTAGDDESSPLGRLRSAAYAMPGLVRDGAHRHVRDEFLSFHEWALDPDADTDDLDLVLTANPASWIDRDELRRRRTASMRSWQWKRFSCGIWVAGENAAISDKEWRACARPGLEIPAGVRDVFVGIDLGWKHDRTALVPVWRPPGEEVVHVHRPIILTPPGDGTSIPVDDVFDPLEEWADRWPGVTFVLDPAADGEHLAQRLDAELTNVTVSTHSQKHTPMCLAASRLSEAISAGRIAHPDDGELNSHVLSAAAKSVGEQWRFAKQRGKDQPIDGVIALAMGLSALIGGEQKPKYRRAVLPM
jgi:phage terminase large subunit-like protein